MPRPRRRRGILNALRLLETGHMSRHAFQKALYSALVPSSTFIKVQSVPVVNFRRFTPCGQYLIAFEQNMRDLAVFRLEPGGRKAPPFAPKYSQHPVDYEASAFPLASHKMEHDYSTILAQPDIHPGTHPPHHLFAVRPQRASGLLSAITVPLAPVPQPNRQPTQATSTPKYSCHFERFFTHMYTMPIASGGETIVSDLSICTTSGRYLILATYELSQQAPIAEQPQLPLPAIVWVVSMHITFHLVEVASGTIVDRFVLKNDNIDMAAHVGVHFYADMLCVLSTRHQLLHIIRVEEAMGRFTEERCIGDMCNREDDLVIARAREAENEHIARHGQRTERGGGTQREQDENAPDHASQDEDGEEADNEDAPAVPKERGLGNGKLQNRFYTGLMHRLLVYVYRCMVSEGNASSFNRMMGNFTLLIMQKAQFLDEDHLLIKLGSYSNRAQLGGMTCFFVVYCMSSSRILNLFANTSEQLLLTFQKYREAFVADAMVSAALPRPRMSVAQEEDGVVERRRRREWNRGGRGASWSNHSHRQGSERVRRTQTELGHIPVSSQTRHSSPYLDRSIFSYNGDKIDALTGCGWVSAKDVSNVKFMSAESGELRFKLSSEVTLLDENEFRQAVGVDVEEFGRRRRKFLFHPMLPFVMAMENNRPVNFHVYGHVD
ncbi:DET1-like [Gracilariopsis chorda]|uniref:DET1-like n=1 Tax=Gracilariopsis chorda TaxID=448386 RepID=A0A2V3IXU2_9FLOR|nr:DET1-like [Gracilariopsis chorda]|eukprot:PXF46507.1 DET1-like [Gracilariopsis chorda]